MPKKLSFIKNPAMGYKNKKPGGVPEIVKKLAIVVLFLLVYRLGSYTPLPFINTLGLSQISRYTNSGILGMLNMLSGGSLSRMSIFALTIVPYISSSILVQLATSSFDNLKKLKADGPSGQAKIHQYTKYLTLLIAFVQGFGVAKTIGAMNLYFGDAASGTILQHLGVALTLSVGTIFLMWLGERITALGIGNGISLIIFVGIVTELPRVAYSSLELLRSGVIPAHIFLLLTVLFVVVMAFIIMMEGSHRSIPINQPNMRQPHMQQSSQPNYIPLKINPCGVIPPIFATSILLIPSTLSGFAGGSSSPILSWVLLNFSHGKPLFMICFAALVIFFTFFYTSLIFDTKETASQLRKSNSFIPGIRPGDATASYLNRIMLRLNLIGALYLTAVCLLPEFISSFVNQSLVFGGTTLLIIVNVSIETVGQIRLQMMSKKYEKLFNRYKN